jgi:hypothetical protein
MTKRHSCEEFIHEITEKAKTENAIKVPNCLTNIKQAWWQNDFLMVLDKYEWSEPRFATDEEFKQLTQGL